MNSRKDRAFRPGASGLEPRALMSVIASPPTDGAEVALLAAARAPAATAGTVSGRYASTAQDMRAADAPLPVRLSGSGTVRGLGRVQLAGSLAFGGFRLEGSPDISGTVTLTNARGSVRVRLAGSGGFSDVPNSEFGLTATIVRGTGAYANRRGIGLVVARFGRDAVRGEAIGGPLTLRLDLSPPIR